LNVPFFVECRLYTGLFAAFLLVGCGGRSALHESAGYGVDPALPKPHVSVVSRIHGARAVGWGERQGPKAASGTTVAAFARDLEHPRWVYVLPNGDVLVAETNAPIRPEEDKGLRGKVTKVVEGRAGGAVPSPDRIALLRDSDGDGVADLHTDFLTGLTSPFGMVLVGDQFYVADTDALLKFPYHDGDTRIDVPPLKVTDLPAGPRNHHWTKSLVASPDGARLYVGVGSNSNAAENGFDEEIGRAAIWEIDLGTGTHREYAAGLRNPVGMAWHGDQLWVAVNERDDLGNDLVPDYLAAVKPGGFYGWPYSYFGSHLDPRVKPRRPDLVATAIVPDYALGAHTASLGLCSSKGTTLPFKDGMFVGQHGSWNREPASGYKVLFVPFASGKPVGKPIDVLTGFYHHGDAYGRPVGVAIDRDGGLLVADDVGNVIWRVASADGMPIAADALP
jgi:glucose/arabinose dehydrogenase